jgi:ATP-dependent DNA helicase HFM1/MER3
VIGTNQWRGGSRGYEKMSKSTALQMVGRAGRPGFDTTGTAVIMTSIEDRQNYSTLTLNVVESSLPAILVEGVLEEETPFTESLSHSLKIALCAEISQTVIENIDGAINWLRNTFFYLRARQNPSFYGFSASLRPDQLDHQLNQLTIKSIISPFP